MKEKLNPSLTSTEDLILNQSSFTKVSILYITKFCDARKINSNSIRVLILPLNFRKSRQCALNYLLRKLPFKVDAH